MKQEIIIKNGEVFDSVTGKTEHKDVLIAEGLILDVCDPGKLKSETGPRIIDAAGCLVTPGLIDLHVHLREPGQEWKETIESGARAAVAGGFTTICCMPNTTPVNHSAEISRFITEKARLAGLAKVLPIGAVSIDSSSKDLAPLGEMKDAGCIAFSDDGKPVSNAGLMRRALEWARMLGCPIFGHEEEASLTAKGVMNELELSYKLGLTGWPKAAEEIIISRDIELARMTGGHVHFLHVTTARGVELIRRAKNDHINVSAECCPHHLLLTEADIEGGGEWPQYNTAFKMSPPLRTKEDQVALLAGLNDGTIDAIATDHAPHDLDTKRVEFDKAAFGLIGLQSAFPLVMELVRAKQLSVSVALKALTANPARIISKNDSGQIAKGKRADIAVFDLQKSWLYDSDSILSVSKNTPWIGKTMSGRARDVLVDGKLVLENEKLI